MGVQINLHNPNRSYFAGQTVNGQVVIQNKKADKVKAITILLEGKGLVHWTRNMPGVGNTHYSSRETYVSLISSLAGDGENGIILQNGTTTYPFHFDLPTNIPSSFIGQFGQVSYVLKLEIRRSAVKLNDRAYLPFTVNGLLDLNLEAGSSLPQELIIKKRSKLTFLSRRETNVLLTMPDRSGYVPGEVIKFQVEIDHDGSKKVKFVKVSLKQVIKCYSEEGEKKTSIKICSEVKGPAMKEAKYEWTSNLFVPPGPPTKLGGNCRIVDVQYFLNFEMNISGLNNSISGELPVIIGTIPLTSTFMNFCSSLPRFPLTSHPNDCTTIATTLTFPDYPDIPPPSYAEAVAYAGVALTEAANISRQNTLGQKKDLNADNVPSSSSELSKDDFVPNYVTYVTV